MGFIREVYLYCDGHSPECECDGSEALSADGMFRTIKEYQTAMKKEGWVFRGHLAYCPICAKQF